MVPSPEVIERAAAAVFASPAYAWTPPSATESWLLRTAGRVGTWLLALQEAHPGLMRALLWAMVAVLLAATLRGAWDAYHAVRRRHEPQSRGAARPMPRTGARSADALTAEAEALAAAGRIADAMRLRWAAFDLALRDVGTLQTARALTPRELVGELRAVPARQAALAPALATLYRICYRGDAPTPELWRHWSATLEAVTVTASLPPSSSSVSRAA